MRSLQLQGCHSTRALLGCSGRVLTRRHLRTLPCTHRSVVLPARRLRAVRVENSDTKEAETDTKIKKTITSLDAILGIEEEAEEKPAEKQDSAKPADVVQPAVSVATDVLAEITKKEAERLSASDPKKAAELESQISEQMQKIVESAKKIAEEEGKTRSDGEQQLQQEYMKLMNLMYSNNESLLSKDDVKKLKETVFGPQTFWVVETRALDGDPELRGALLVRGNLRDDVEKVFEHVCTKVQELFGDKVVVLLIPDPEADATPDPRGYPRVAFQLVPTAAAQPPPTAGWQVLVAAVLGILLVAACGQLALVANITKLPKETLEWFADSSNLDSNAIPPGLETWNPVPYLLTTFPIFFSVMGINTVHELGHRIAATIRRVKLGPSYFIPNLQVGSFGAITPFKSLLRNHSIMWDVAFAGPLAGALASGALLFMGLMYSNDPTIPKELLVPVPTQLFQGSLLLGTITRASLGDAALRAPEVFIHPFTIAGWCGLITTALNLLPVGQLDGGRAFQAAFGKSALSLASFFCYVGLGLGFLGSSLSLPFGLYVLICQREAEKFIQDEVSPIADQKRAATAVAILTAVLILLPMAPELADSVGVGQGRML